MLRTYVRRGSTGAVTTQADAAELNYLRVPSRVNLNQRLIFDAGLMGVTLTMAGADAIIELWDRARRDADAALSRPRGDGQAVMTPLNEYEVEHCTPAMSRLMPDDVLAVPGSVHAVLNAYTFGVDPVTRWPVRGVMVTVDSIDGQKPVVIVA